MNQLGFEFRRARGIVWVCDVANSTKYLNDDGTVESIEEYLPRLHWISRLVVKAAGGKYIKWTGDGFLAWFEFGLNRERGEFAKRAFEAAWYLTLLSNTTSLGVAANKKFNIRHGITYEEDALISDIEIDGSKSIDILGRSVVLAFRVSGIPVKFPGIVTQKDLVTESIKKGSFVKTFIKLEFDGDEIIKYFKGEKIGTSSLYATDEIKIRSRDSSSAIKKAKAAIFQAEELIKAARHIKLTVSCS
jgi:hypothetical protein